MQNDETKCERGIFKDQTTKNEGGARYSTETTETCNDQKQTVVERKRFIMISNSFAVADNEQKKNSGGS